MTRILFRGWFVAVIGWWMYLAYLHRDKLDTLFQDRPWALSFENGVNAVLCDFKFLALCRDLNIPFFMKSKVNETFGLIVQFGLIPIVGLLACLLIAWILHRPGKA